MPIVRKIHPAPASPAPAEQPAEQPVPAPAAPQADTAVARRPRGRPRRDAAPAPRAVAVELPDAPEQVQGDGELPPGWVWTTISEVCLVNGRDDQLRDLPDNLPISFVPMSAVDGESGAIVVPEQRELGAVRKGYTSFREGDVLFAKITPCMENGKAAIARKLVNGRGFGSTEFHVLRPRSEVLPEWIYYFVRQERFRDDAKANFTGTAGQLRVPARFFDGYPIPLPPLAEQRRIVEAIEAQLTRLDAGVAGLRAAQARLKRYRASVLKAACDGRLVPQDPSDEPAEALLARVQGAGTVAQGRRGRGRQSSFLEAEQADAAELPELPQGWCYSLLEPLLSTSRRGMKTGPFGSLLKKNEHQSKGVPVLGIENIGEMRFLFGNKIYITASKADELREYDIQSGDILVSRSGTVGEVCVIPEGLGEARFSTNLMRVVLEPGILEPMFFCFLFNGAPFVLKQIEELCKGTTRLFLNQSILSSIVFPLPPLAEQRRIVAEVERRLSVAGALEAALAANLRRAERLRQAILRRAFAGRLAPQDPGDEPPREGPAGADTRRARGGHGQRRRARAGGGAAGRAAADGPRRAVTAGCNGVIRTSCVTMAFQGGIPT